MFEYGQKATGAGYTKTASLVAVAFVFCPALLLASRPVEYVSLSLAIACSALCLMLAWIDWKKSSRARGASLSMGARND